MILLFFLHPCKICEKKTVSVSSLKKWPLAGNFTTESKNGKAFVHL